ncbi:MAG: DUF3280 domain-containing protein [Hyphomicrobium sp.]
MKGLKNTMWNLRLCVTMAIFGLWAFSPAMAAVKTAVFPFDIRDIEQESEVVPVPKEADQARLKLIADELRSLLAKDARYELVDLTPQAAEVEKASPFNKCDGCETPIAAAAGADIAVTGVVEKWSDALISIQLFVRDVKTGELKRAMSAESRGNTDELWLHAIRWIWRNRFTPEEQAKP